MKPGGGRAKGSAFERHVSKLIVTAFESSGITSRDCYRTPSSGGHRFAKRKDPGDLVISKRLRRLFPFSVECKFVRRLLWSVLFSNRKSKQHWSVWWEQAKIASSRQCPPILIFRENRGEVFVILRAEASSFVMFNTRASVRINGENLVLVRLDTLFRWLKKGQPF